MSDTTTPSAAEVMDLRGRHQYGRSGYCDWCDTPESAAFIDECPDAPTPTPTPDDMLAWLREQGWDVTVDQAFDGPLLVSVVHFNTHAHAVDPEEPRTSLNAALEAAVIAVGRAG